jgi:hypothetical protein
MDKKGGREEGRNVPCSVRERERFLLQLQAFQEQSAVQEQQEEGGRS